MIYSRIAGTGSALPKKIVTNHDLEKIMDTSDQWIRERTGICSRRVISEGESTVSLAEEACRNAIEAAGVDPAEIDLFVMGTTTPDLVFPSSACLIQKRLGLPDCGAMEHGVVGDDVVADADVDGHGDRKPHAGRGPQPGFRYRVRIERPHGDRRRPVIILDQTSNRFQGVTKQIPRLLE